MRIYRQGLYELARLGGMGDAGFKFFTEMILRDKQTRMAESFIEIDMNIDELSPWLYAITLNKDLTEKILRTIKKGEQNNIGMSRKLLLPDKEYPRLLKDITDPPKWLVYEGDISVLKKPSLTIVGTRKCSSLGEREAKRLVDFCREMGIVTVSGLAKGIDSVVHEYSLKRGVLNVAVVPGDLENIMPSAHQNLAKGIVASGGLLLSEKEKIAGYSASVYPRRNRILAGLSRSTVIIEAPVSSGALNTAKYADGYNRNVYVYLGDPLIKSFAGNHNLYDDRKAMPLSASYTQLVEDFSEVEFKPEKTINAASTALRFFRKQFRRNKDKVPLINKLDIILRNKSQLEKYIIKEVYAGTNDSRTLYELICRKFTENSLNLSQFNVTLAKMQLSNLISIDEYGKLSVNI